MSSSTLAHDSMTDAVHVQTPFDMDDLRTCVDKERTAATTTTTTTVAKESQSQGDGNGNGLAFCGRVSPEVMRDFIIGFSDGVTVPFALTAGMSMTGSSRIVVMAGLAELASGAISMAVGGYLSAKTEYDHYRSMLKFMKKRVEDCQTQAMEAEVEDVMQSTFGIPKDSAKHLANSLVQVERDQASDQAKGLTPFLLQVGYGLDEVPARRVYQSALMIGISYLCGGFIPLLPYLFCPDVKRALYISIGVTCATLLLFGGVKQQLVDLDKGQGMDMGRKWSWRTSVYGACTTLAVGGLAAGAAFGIVLAIEGHTSIGGQKL